jgi:predicted lipoprotein with Yx(FWY)xxD motif
MHVRGLTQTGGGLALVIVIIALAAGCGSGGSAAATAQHHRHSSMPMSGTNASSTAMPTPKHAMLAAKKTKYGDVLFASDGKVLYTFGPDKHSMSTCYGACASAWPPVTTKSMPMAGSGIDQSLLGTTRRTDGTLQVTYDGHPLYTYVGDRPGAIMCQNANMHGGLWLVISAMGMPVKGGGSAM